jgi:predicted dienelactone hydrolase
MKRRTCLQALACTLAWGAWPLHAQGEVEVLDRDWVDTARDRPVPVRLYRPGIPGLAPLVVFSHGIGGSRNGYSYLGRYLAEQGVASLHLQHVGSDRSLWGGNPFTLVGRLQDAAQDTEAVARVQDLAFALDRVFDSDWISRVDPWRVVAAGHSYGANTALLAAGARVKRDGVAIELRDPRVKAAIAISAPPFYGETDLSAVLGGIRVPSLHVTATEDVIRIPGFYSGADDRLAVFDATGGPQARKWLAVFDGGSHSIFTDRAGSGGPVLNPQVKQATGELALAFVRAVFDDDLSALIGWPQRHQDIVARFVAPS